MSLSYCTIVNYFKTQENLDTSPQTSDSKLDEFCYSNSKLYEIRVQWIVILRNSNSIKLEIFEVFKTKLANLSLISSLNSKKWFSCTQAWWNLNLINVSLCKQYYLDTYLNSWNIFKSKYEETHSRFYPQFQYF